MDECYAKRWVNATWDQCLLCLPNALFVRCYRFNRSLESIRLRGLRKSRRSESVRGCAGRLLSVIVASKSQLNPRRSESRPSRHHKSFPPRTRSTNSAASRSQIAGLTPISKASRREELSKYTVRSRLLRASWRL